MTITDRQARELKDTIERGTIADAVKLLKVIAPEAFKPALVEHAWSCEPVLAWARQPNGHTLLTTRTHGSLKGQFYLSPDVAWTLEPDGTGIICLVAREKA